ncbi:MAG: hypothetical protein BGP10_06165 [Rhodanobacter sp. 68-29]|nr:DUF4157 domain-containing protein [Rhodanobacter sp.]ODU74064.1 MAG: hypothetical protein ABT17_09400 [Rhodanobacter sp. SCN 69-32]OJY55421.1 MAG: hypothetical protein BGP10_06165 [Rhodanobacter sp. 68-29]
MSERSISATRAPAATGSHPGGILQRKCACGRHAPGGGECAQCAQERKRVQRLATGGPEAGAAPASVHGVLASPGRPLDATARSFMEPRFAHGSGAASHVGAAPVAGGPLQVGAANDPLERQADDMARRVMTMAAPAAAPGHDFSRVRVHTDDAAAASAQELGARAYTVGEHIAFARGEYAPGTAAGRQLLAHELTHTLQQAQGGVALQRFVPCTRARMSLEDCPQREPDEDRTTRAQPMILEYVTAPEAGFLVANFDIGKDVVKGGLTRHPLWPTLVGTVSAAKSQWEIIGLSDCQGEAPLNTALRKERADAVRAVLPAAAAVNVTGTSGASLNDCMTTNDNAVARQWNRAALIRAVSREYTFEDEKIEGKRPVPKPVAQDTADCNTDQKKAIAQAQPIAVDMVREALYRLRDHTNADTKLLLRTYFGDDGEKTFEHVHDGLLTILQGLKNITVECEAKGTLFYDHFCGGGPGTVTRGYSRSKWIGLHVHLCEGGFDQDDVGLAKTLVHECSHLYDGTDDKGYCWEDGGTRCSTMGASAAYDNADSYAYFAHAAWLNQ